jgi:hypothetical protein
MTQLPIFNTLLDIRKPISFEDREKPERIGDGSC